MASLTLTGSESTVEEVCLLCGTRGTADALLNVVLFVPLGVALGGWRHGLTKAILAGLSCSMAVEVIQTGIPGRYATFADVWWNALGAGLGVWTYGLVRSRLEDDEEGLRPRGGVTWGVLLALGFFFAGLLMTPFRTPDDYWASGTPILRSMAHHEGRLGEVNINGSALPSRRINRPRPEDVQLGESWVVEARFVVALPPTAVLPIVSIYDGHQHEILFLGRHRDDFVFRERMLGHEFGFDVPDIRIPDAFTWLVPGDSTVIRGRRSGGETCLRLGGLERCGAGATPGRTWGLLLYVEGPQEWFRRIVDMGWLTVLFLPVGFLGRSGRHLAVGSAIAVLGMTGAVIATPLIASPWYELMACLGGVVAGRLGFLRLRSIARDIYGPKLAAPSP